MKTLKLFCTMIFVCTNIFASVQIWTNQDKFELSQDFLANAHQTNQHINSPLFCTDFMKNTKKVRKYLLDENGCNAQIINCLTEDGEKINCYFFDRNSENLVVIFNFFANPKEILLPFIGLFDCDVVLADFRGTGYNTKKASWYNPFTWKLNFIKNKCHFINAKKVKMGEVEHKDVIGVVETFKNRKSYKTVCGHGLCYAGDVLIKSQAIYKQETEKNLFDKLICDGIWLNLESAIKNFTNYKLDRSGFSWVKNHKFLVNTILWFTEISTRVPFRKFNFDLLDYIDQIDIPILFFHSRFDKIAPFDDFEIIWDSTKKSENKIAVITENRHITNHLKQKELYKFLCDQFIQNDLLEKDTFVR